MNKSVLNIQRLDPVESLTGCEKCAAMRFPLSGKKIDLFF